jgi:hypothetical protein
VSCPKQPTSINTCHILFFSNFSPQAKNLIDMTCYPSYQM